MKKNKSAKPWLNYVRVPVVISFLLLLCYFPIILRLTDDRHLYTGLSPDSYLYRWLLVTAALAAGSAFSYFLSKQRAKRQPSSESEQQL